MLELEIEDWKLQIANFSMDNGLTIIKGENNEGQCLAGAV